MGKDHGFSGCSPVFQGSWLCTSPASVAVFGLPQFLGPLATSVPYSEMVLAAPPPVGPREEFGFCFGAHQLQSGSASGGEGEMECSGLLGRPHHGIQAFHRGVFLQSLPGLSLLKRMPASHKTTEGGFLNRGRSGPDSRDTLGVVRCRVGCSSSLPLSPSCS